MAGAEEVDQHVGGLGGTCTEPADGTLNLRYVCGIQTLSRRKFRAAVPCGEVVNAFSGWISAQRPQGDRKLRRWDQIFGPLRRRVLPGWRLMTSLRAVR